LIWRKYYNTGTLERTVKFSAGGIKMVDVFKMLSSSGITEKDVDSVTTGKPVDIVSSWQKVQEAKKLFLDF
jgi:hypothetical protein